MKKIFLLVILASFIVGCSADDSIRNPPSIVFPGNLVLRTQADVNAVGAQGYNVIAGALFIGDVANSNNTPTPSDITDLSPLSTITSVGRQIQIQSNPQLTSLDGLSNLAVVSGLIISDNEALTSLDGISNLSGIDRNTILTGQTFVSGGMISITDNPALTSIESLSSINKQVIAEVTVRNSSLTSLAGLENLTRIGRLNIVNNETLTSLDALESLVEIGSTVLIFRNNALTNYCSLQPSLQNNTNLLIYNVYDNQFNPTQQQIIDGNCIE
ncbi:MAG: hypothetical protein AAF617_13760 [Bacteroidota bacterium]